eukprot:CAMPEP_0114228476 /NCGR_PEP_ID=MMETSP0058-20121206/2368_1 /TAXON_ID=36894 /ORGANISM="Pyramimonas parkeae, CCMP726" /LENGTH=62 /DNA_ID=CAMNT_0001339435 /DNA_START=125 /DNA_END=313 /DNA_ORIENTATION=+
MVCPICAGAAAASLVQAVAPGVLAAGVAAATGNEAVKNLRLKNDASKDKLQRKPQPKSKGGN